MRIPSALVACGLGILVGCGEPERPIDGVETGYDTEFAQQPGHKPTDNSLEQLTPSSAGAPASLCPDGSIKYLGTCAGDNVLTSIQGYWTRQDSNCRERFAYKVVANNHTRYIVLEGQQGGSQITTIDAATISTRDLEPNAAGKRESWIWQLAGDTLSLTDSNGVTTTLTRCR